MRLVVGFDDQAVTLQERGGISRYYMGLIGGLRSLSSIEDVTAVPLWHFAKNRQAIEAGARTLPTTKVTALRAANRLVLGANPHQRHTSVIHHTGTSPGYLCQRQFTKKPRVVTVHDMIPELFPEMFPLGNPHESKRESVEAADLIICISESTKLDLVSTYGTPSAPLVVTPLQVTSGSVCFRRLPRHRGRRHAICCSWEVGATTRTSMCCCPHSPPSATSRSCWSR